MKKKILSIILALILTVSISVPAFAASFSDLDNHWSEEYMVDLYNRGYFSGYDDGTMRPDNAITACETLALLSRFYDPDDDALEFIAEDYEDYVEETVSSSLSWAYDEIMVCLAAGIITESELKSIKLSEAITKEDLSVFLIRAMKLSDEAGALNSAELTFDDADDVSASCVGSIAELAYLGIVKGDDENNFSPKLSVTRAVVATMVSRALDYLENSKITLEIENYEGTARVEGIITSASSTKIYVCGFDGMTRYYEIPSTAAVTVNGAAKTLTSTYGGCRVTLSTKDAAVTSVAVESDDAVMWVQGSVYSVFDSSSTDYIYFTDLDTGSQTRYYISSNAVITLDGAAVSLSSLKMYEFATLKIENSSVTVLQAVSSDYEITGTVAAIGYGSTITLNVKDKDGTVFAFDFDISAPPSIYRGTTAITIDRLSVGDEVVIAIENCGVKSITSEGSEDSITGELTSIISTTSGTQWVIKTDDGTTTLTVDENAGVYSGTAAILLTDVQAGDTVTVMFYGSTITEIYLVSSTNSATKVSGTILTVNTTGKVITILTSSNKIVYVSTSSVSYIINGSTGKTLSLSGLAVDSELVAYGTYSDSTTFVAKSIVIES